MRTLVGLGVAGLVSVLPLSTSASFSATSPKPTDLPQSYLFTATGELTPLGAGTRYAASRFPLPIRVTVVEPGWSGTQWRSGHDYFRGGGPPTYGWVHLGRIGLYFVFEWSFQVALPHGLLGAWLEG